MTHCLHLFIKIIFVGNIAEKYSTMPMWKKKTKNNTQLFPLHHVAIQWYHFNGVTGFL